MADKHSSRVVDGREGAEQRRIRAEGAKVKCCTGCRGLTILLRDGLCKYCFNEKVYHACQ